MIRGAFTFGWERVRTIEEVSLVIMQTGKNVQKTFFGSLNIYKTFRKCLRNVPAEIFYFCVCDSNFQNRLEK